MRLSPTLHACCSGAVKAEQTLSTSPPQIYHRHCRFNQFKQGIKQQVTVPQVLRCIRFGSRLLSQTPALCPTRYQSYRQPGCTHHSARPPIQKHARILGLKLQGRNSVSCAALASWHYNLTDARSCPTPFSTLMVNTLHTGSCLVNHHNKAEL